MKSALFFVVTCIFVVDFGLSLCAQANPRDCPEFFAVACHDDANHAYEHSLSNFAVARVRETPWGEILDEQTVGCHELPGDTNDDDGSETCSNGTFNFYCPPECAYCF